MIYEEIKSMLQEQDRRAGGAYRAPATALLFNIVGRLLGKLWVNGLLERSEVKEIIEGWERE